MGVRGLNTFFNRNPHLSKDYSLHDTTVVIDGNNLVHMLYHSHNLDCVYGGEFDRFASIIKKYFSSYLACNITPIVIFDGAMDRSNRKLRTTLKRYKKRLTLARRIVKYNGCPERVLPITVHMVFRDILTEIGISYAQCDFEADDHLTALANYYKCPVLSNDSDFYIFDLQYGFIRLESIETHLVSYTNESSQTQNVLRCQIYHIDDFLTFFPGIDKRVLPLFGTLMGNDYVDIGTFDSFFANIMLPKFKSKRRLLMNEQQKKMIRLLCWFKDNNLEEAISLVLRYLSNNQREYVKNIIAQSIDVYKIPISRLTKIIDGSNEIESTFDLGTNLTRPCGHPLPLWFIHQFNSSVFPPDFINAILLHKVFLQCQVEDVDLESSHTCSRYIRQILYGVLLPHLDESLVECVNEDCTKFVEEYDHRSGNIIKDKAYPIFHDKSMTVLPTLDSLNSIDHNYAETLINSILNEKTDCSISVPSHWRLLFLSIRYYLRNSNSPPSEEFIYALIVNVIYFGLLNNKMELQNKKGTSYYTQDTITSLMHNINPSVAQTAINNIKKYLNKPIANNAFRLVVGIIDNFNQLQSCVLYINHLNKLIGLPYDNIKVHESFGGVLMYNLTRDFASRPFPELFVAQLLGRESVIYNLFLKLKSVVLEGECSNTFVKIDLAQRNQNQKRSKKKSKLVA